MIRRTGIWRRHGLIPISAFPVRPPQPLLIPLKRLLVPHPYATAVDKLRALSAVKPFEGDNTALSGMSNAESAKILSEAKKRGREKALERVSALVDGITTETREIITEAVLETPQTIAAWSEKYEHYVPLHWDEVAGNSAHPVGQGFNIRGRESKRATGSNREITNILACGRAA